jgi:hypothetical protein
MTKRSALILDAIQVALGELAKVSDCEEKRELETRARACESIVRGWKNAPPSSDEREATMQTVLSLHVSVTRLRRTTTVPPA